MDETTQKDDASPPALPATAMKDEPRDRPERRHHIIVRTTHWLAFPLVFAMIASGLQIYRAYPRFGERGGPLLPNPFQDTAFPEWARLGGWLAGGINWHFMLMWPLVAVGLVYLIYVISSGEWKNLLFRPADVRPALEMAKYYLRIRKDHPPQGKHNSLQKQAYTFIVVLGVLSVVTGIAMWKPVQFPWLVAALGGFQAARLWHFMAVWLFVAFTIVHIVLVLFVEPWTLRAMVTGRASGGPGRSGHVVRAQAGGRGEAGVGTRESDGVREV
jgi:thiosulfate reductase cytochrome b subunit